MAGGHETLPRGGDAVRVYPDGGTRFGSADLAVAVLAPRGELVLGAGDRLAPVGPLAGEVGDGSGELPHGARHRDAEDALAALEQVDDLLGGRALVDGGAVGEQRDVGEVLDSALAQMVDGDPDVVQRDAGVQ